MEKPARGSIRIEWTALGDPDPESGDYPEFDWKLDLDPPGLSDEEIARLLAEIAERF